ncbi:MAG: ATP-binding protein [Elusimicrobiota bacterium]
MLIKTKITVTLVIFILLFSLMSLFYFYTGNKQTGYYNVTENLVKRLEAMKATAGIFDEQVKIFEDQVYSDKEYNVPVSVPSGPDEKEKNKTVSVEGMKDSITRSQQLLVESAGPMYREMSGTAVKMGEQNILLEIDILKNRYAAMIARLEKHIQESRNVAGSFHEKVTFYSVILIMICMTVFILSGISVYTSITAPLKELVIASKNIGQGNLDYKIKIKEHNEFYSISRSFDQMAADLKEYHNKMTQLSKMAAIGELAGGVAHEINNPMTGILGNVQLLLKKVHHEDKSYPLLQKIERASIRCQNIVADLLDFSRKEREHIKLNKVDINDILETTFTFCSSEMLSSDIELIKDYGSDLPQVEVSERSIQQAFLNIINNAMQAMPSGGKFTVYTGIAELDGNYYVEIRFTDTGSGFDGETGEHLFEPFFTTRDVGEGTGLGLSLAFRIVENHGGRITAKSIESEKGAVFSIFLPINSDNHSI